MLATIAGSSCTLSFSALVTGCAAGTLRDSLDRWFGTMTHQKASEEMLARAHRFVPEAESDIASLLDGTDSKPASTSLTCVDAYVQATTWREADEKDIPESELRRYITTGGATYYATSSKLSNAKTELKECAEACSQKEGVRDLNVRYRRLCSILEAEVDRTIAARSAADALPSAAEEEATAPRAEPAPVKTMAREASTTPPDDGTTWGIGFGTVTVGLGICQRPGNPTFPVTVDGVRAVGGATANDLGVTLGISGAGLECARARCASELRPGSGQGEVYRRSEGRGGVRE